MKISTFIASRFRPRLIFPLLRVLNGIPLLRNITVLYDPNIIQKNSNVILPGKLTELDKPGYKLVVNLNDHIGYWSYVRQRPFEQSVYHIAKRLGLGQDDAILDIGANIGTASIPVCAELGCELIAIEASKANAALLLKNASLNGIRMQAHILALTSQDDANTYMPLYVRSGNSGANSLLESWSSSDSGKQFEMVPTKTLDQIMLDEDLVQRVKIVKIDVEGAESHVIKGGKEFFSRCPALVLMEYRIDVLGDELKSEMSDLIEFMKQYYDLFGLGEQGQEFAFDPKAAYENILFRPKPSAHPAAKAN